MKAAARSEKPSSQTSAWLWIFAVGVAAGAGFFLGRSGVGRAARPATPGIPEKFAMPSASICRPTRWARPRALENSTAMTAGAEWHERWTDLQAEPDTPARDRALALAIETLARSDPARALAAAQAEPNWRLRDLLRDAALRGWASVTPDAAGEWVLKLRRDERRSAVEAVLNGAAAEPDAAIRLGTRLCEADPLSALEYGQTAIEALGRAGAYAAAARFAIAEGGAHGVLLTAAYAQWAERDADAALVALQTIDDPSLHRSAFEGFANGWAAADPARLAGHAQQLPIGEERSVALGVALSRWVERDPIAAAEWIKSNDPGRDSDDGIAAVANLSPLVETRPETALQWSDLIMDPAKRTLARQSVLARWAARDPAAARRFAESLSSPEERAAALAAVGVTGPGGN